MNEKKLKKEKNLIRVKYYTKNKIIKEGKFDINVTFGKILDYFIKNNSNKFYQLKSKYIFNGKTINNNQIVSKLIHINKNSSLEKAEIWIEINIDNNKQEQKEENDIIQKKILKPTKNPFGLIIITPSNRQISFKKFTEEISRKHGLYNFNYTSAYCDSPDYLFISGGEQNFEISNGFWIIEHGLYNIKYKQMPYKKKIHSMIYVNEDLVFIVGGNTIETFYYDIKKDEFIKCGDLNELIQEPTLIRINDYIYCLSNLQERNYFERINIKKFSGTWEKINPVFSYKNKIDFTSYFFSASYFDNNNIILCGGNNVTQNTFSFNYLTNILIQNEGKDDNIELGDKQLYPIDGKNYIGISKHFEVDQEIIILNKNTKNVRKIKCDIKSNSDSFYSIEKDEKEIIKEESLGIVSIYAKLNDKYYKGVHTFINLGPDLDFEIDDFRSEEKLYKTKNNKNSKSYDNEKHTSNKQNYFRNKIIDETYNNICYLEVKVNKIKNHKHKFRPHNKSTDICKKKNNTKNNGHKCKKNIINKNNYNLEQNKENLNDNKINQIDNPINVEYFNYINRENEEKEKEVNIMDLSKEKEHKEKYNYLRRNILEYKSFSDMYGSSQNQLGELVSEEENTNYNNATPCKIKEKLLNGNGQNSNLVSSPLEYKEFYNLSDMSDFKYYQNRLEHFEKKFGVKNNNKGKDLQNKKYENIIEESSKIFREELDSIFYPLTRGSRYPKIDSSFPYSLRDSELFIDPKKSSDLIVYKSMKEKNINAISFSLYNTLFKNDKKDKNLPVIDSSKIYLFQK